MLCEQLFAPLMWLSEWISTPENISIWTDCLGYAQLIWITGRILNWENTASTSLNITVTNSREHQHLAWKLSQFKTIKVQPVARCELPTQHRFLVLCLQDWMVLSLHCVPDKLIVLFVSCTPGHLNKAILKQWGQCMWRKCEGEVGILWLVCRWFLEVKLAAKSALHQNLLLTDLFPLALQRSPVVCSEDANMSAKTCWPISVLE